MSMTISEIAAALPARFEGEGTFQIDGPAEPAAAGEADLALAMDPSYSDALQAGAAKAAVLWDGADWKALGLEAALFVERPRFAMASITRVFGHPNTLASGIHPSAVIDPTAQIGDNAAVGPFCVIGPRARIGAGAHVNAHSSIGADAQIGDNAVLQEGVRVGARVSIGDNFIAQPGAVIGADGFSYVTPQPGAIDEVKGQGRVTEGHDAQEFTRIDSIGAVWIGDNVEIGANSTIDRGTITDTVIGDGTKLDNLVQVGHNAKIGKMCLLCGQVGVGGSAVIEDRVVLGGQVGVADHVTVGSNVIAAGKSGISSNVPPNRAIMGNPAILMEANVNSYKAYRRLPRFLKKIETLEAEVARLLKR